MKGISIKSQEEIELMREAGRILAITHEEMRKALKPGMTTYDIDKLGEEVIRSYHCEPSFLNYQGYPASVCVSLHDEVVHGIPSKNRVLQDGDIVSLDAGVIYKGYHSDSARTYGVGEISDMAKYLIEATKQSFFEGLSAARAMPMSVDLELLSIWWDMELEKIFMKSRRSQTSQQEEEDRS